jgi:D-glycero-alpha-D-manno-heptose-7-phosphate kinase
MVITRTPLRVSFFGGGTDLAEFYTEHGGAVLSTTIDKYIYIIVKERFDDLIVLNYSEREKVERVEDIRHNIFREALRLAGVRRGVEITSIGDIPSSGSGLGSSSSFTVGLLNALFAYTGETRSPRDLAEAACAIEIGILKEPIGKQDQYAASFGGLRRYRFARDGKVEAEPIVVGYDAFLTLQRACLLYYTNVTRKASSVLSDQRSRIPSTTDSLLRLAGLAEGMDAAFEAGDIQTIGQRLHENWEEKKKLSVKVSNGEIDAIYERGLAAGAIGGKLLGAGGGGFFLFLCPPERQGALRSAMCGLRELPISFTRHGSKVIMDFEEHIYPLD